MTNEGYNSTYQIKNVGELKGGSGILRCTQIGTMLSRLVSDRPSPSFSLIFATSSPSALARVVASRFRIFLNITMRSGESEERSCGATVVDKGDVGTKVPNEPIDLPSLNIDPKLVQYKQAILWTETSELPF